jgi:hypothetical protein
LTSNLRTSVLSPVTRNKISLCPCAKFPQERDPQDSEADTLIIGRNLEGRYASSYDADAPKPPAYPFIHQIFKERSSDKKRAIRQFLAYPFAPCLQIFRAFRQLLPRAVPVTATSRLRWRRIYGGSAAPARGKNAILAKISRRPEIFAKSGG